MYWITWNESIPAASTGFARTLLKVVFFNIKVSMTLPMKERPDDCVATLLSVEAVPSEPTKTSTSVILNLGIVNQKGRSNHGHYLLTPLYSVFQAVHQPKSPNSAHDISSIICHCLFYLKFPQLSHCRRVRNDLYLAQTVQLGSDDLSKSMKRS